MENEINDISKEISVILKYTDKNIVNKFPPNILKAIELQANKSQKNVEIDKEKKLKDQDISSEAKDIIAAMYYYYIADDKEKNDILSAWKSNDK